MTTKPKDPRRKPLQRNYPVDRPHESMVISEFASGDGVQIGQTCIYFDHVVRSGRNGGKETIKLVIIGPTETKYHWL